MTAAQSDQTVEAVLAKREEMATKAARSKAYRKLSDRLMRRQAIGVDAPANDNIGWPLAEQLRRDGNETLLWVAERYRTIYDAAKFEPRLVGTMPDDFWSPEQRHSVGADGVLRRKGAKSGKNAMPADDGTYKAVAITEDAWADMVADGPVTFPRRPGTPTMRKWNGDDALIAAIDARPMLDRLQAKLGPLVDVFEDAVITGMTLTEVGRTRGEERNAGPAGRVLVMLGLETVQSEFAAIDREARVNMAANG